MARVRMSLTVWVFWNTVWRSWVMAVFWAICSKSQMSP